MKSRDVCFGLLMVAALLSATGCRTPKSTASHDYRDSVIVQRLIPVVLPNDTARLHAMLECDARGRILANRLDVETTRNMRLTFLLDSIGRLLVETYTERDTVYLPADSVFVDRETVVTERIEIEVPARLSSWKRFMMQYGTGAFWLTVGAVMAGAVWLVLKIRK